MAYKSNKSAEVEFAKNTEVGLVNIEAIFPLVADIVDQLYSQEHLVNTNECTGISTGFDSLDSVTSGLHKGELIVLTGLPYMGKTTLALNIIENFVLDNILAVAVFSMGIANTKLVMQLISSVGRLDQHRLQTGQLKMSDWSKLVNAFDKLNHSLIFIDERAGLNGFDVRESAHNLIIQGCELGLIVVDNLQPMIENSSNNCESHTTEVSEILCELKRLAKELDVPVIVVSPLNCTLGDQSNKPTVITDLLECWVNEQNVDMVLLIDRDEVNGTADISIAKQRNGSVGKVKLRFLRQYLRFEEVD